MKNNHLDSELNSKQEVDLINKNNGTHNDKMDAIVQFYRNNHIVAFDVDQTLVMWDETPYEPGPGKLKFTMPGNNKTVYLKPHNKHIFTLQTYIPRGFTVLVWSAAGAEWAKEVVNVLNLQKNVNIIMSKISIHFDDLPPDQILGQHLYFHDTLDSEIWKDCKGFEGLYQVSNYGRVRRITNLNKYEIKHQGTHTNGYSSVQFSKNKKSKVLTVHRLVAEAFIENKENKKAVNHKDGNKKNNNVYNLEWVSISENNFKKINKTKFNTQSGELNGSAKLKSEDVLFIYKNLKNNKMKVMELAKQFNVSKTTISFIRDKKSWKSHTDNLDNEN